MSSLPLGTGMDQGSEWALVLYIRLIPPSLYPPQRYMVIFLYPSPAGKNLSSF